MQSEYTVPTGVDDTEYGLRDDTGIPRQSDFAGPFNGRILGDFPANDPPEQLPIPQPTHLSPRTPDVDVIYALLPQRGGFAGEPRSDVPMDDLRLAIAPLLRHVHRASALRESVLALRRRSKAEWQACTRNLDFVGESQDEFLQEAKTLQARIPAGFSVDRLRTLHGRVSEDHDRQSSKVRILLDIESQLQRLEARMQSLEGKVEKDVRALNDLLGQVEDASDRMYISGSEAEGCSSQVSAGIESKRPVIVEHYLDKVGDMKIARDKLYDLDQEHIEEKAQRQLLQDQGLTLDSSDDQFEKRWLRVFAVAEVALVEASNRVALARQACELEDTDPEAERKKLAKSPHTGAPTPLLSNTPVQPVSPLHLAWELAGDVHTPLGQAFSDLMETTAPGDIYANDPFDSPSQRQKDTSTPQLERVKDWVELISDDQPQSPGPLDDSPSRPDEQYGRPVEEYADQVNVDPPRESMDADAQKPQLQHTNPQPTVVLNLMERPSARSRSISDSSPLESISGDHPRQANGLPQPSMPKKHYRSLASYMAGWVKDEDGDERPAFVQRSSSESQLLVLKAQADVPQSAWLTFRNAKPGEDVTRLFTDKLRASLDHKSDGLSPGTEGVQ